MESLSNRKKVVSDKKMTFWESIYLPAVLGGMWITFKHLFRKHNVTKYPEETREFAPVYRGQHVLKRDEEGRENCTACGLCEDACPKEAIFLTDRIVPTYFERDNFIYGKDKLVEKVDERIDISKRQLTGKRPKNS